MLKLIASFLALFLFATVALAGGSSNRKPINSVTPWTAPDETTARAVEYKNTTIEKTIIEKYVKPIPAKGMFYGFVEAIPVIGLSFDDSLVGQFSVAAGYTSLNGNQMAILTADKSFWQSEDKYQSLNAGLAIYPGNNNMLGGYLGVESYLCSNIAVSMLLWPVRVNNLNQTNVSEASLAGKVFF